MRQAALASFAAVIVVLGALSAGISTAQQPQQAKPLQFEVAAIKPSDPKLPAYSCSSGGGPGGQYRMVNTPLKQWVEMGLSVSDYALKAPSWLDTSRFDLDARLPTYKPDDHNATAEMMKALLIERFGLKWHEELQTVSGYELVPDKKVLAQPATPLERLRGRGGWGSGPASYWWHKYVDVRICGGAGKDTRKARGRRNAPFRWIRFQIGLEPDGRCCGGRGEGCGMKDADIDNLPSIFTAVREQLGLRLQSAKVPSKVIVVDQINPQPTAN